jgi:hypothetical protein
MLIVCTILISYSGEEGQDAGGLLGSGMSSSPGKFSIPTTHKLQPSVLLQVRRKGDCQGHLSQVARMLLCKILLQTYLPNLTKNTRMMTSKKLSPWNLSPVNHYAPIDDSHSVSQYKVVQQQQAAPAPMEQNIVALMMAAKEWLTLLSPKLSCLCKELEQMEAGHIWRMCPSQNIKQMWWNMLCLNMWILLELFVLFVILCVLIEKAWETICIGTINLKLYDA